MAVDSARLQLLALGKSASVHMLTGFGLIFVALQMARLDALQRLMRLQAVDSLFLQYLVHKTLEKSASVHLLFAFEYVILASAIVSTFLKYTLSMIDAWLEGRWEHKGVYVFYLELLTDMLHLVVYLVFFVIVFTNFGLPVHLVRLSAISQPSQLPP